MQKNKLYTRNGTPPAGAPRRRISGVAVGFHEDVRFSNTAHLCHGVTANDSLSCSETRMKYGVSDLFLPSALTLPRSGGFFGYPKNFRKQQEI